MPNELDKIRTERGPGRDLSQPYSVSVQSNVSYTGQGADWFGPLQPPKPLAPPEVEGRALD